MSFEIRAHNEPLVQSLEPLVTSHVFSDKMSLRPIDFEPLVQSLEPLVTSHIFSDKMSLRPIDIKSLVQSLEPLITTHIFSDKMSLRPIDIKSLVQSLEPLVTTHIFSDKMSFEIRAHNDRYSPTKPSVWGWPKPYMYGAYTVCLEGKSPKFKRS